MLMMPLRIARFNRNCSHFGVTLGPCTRFEDVTRVLTDRAIDRAILHLQIVEFQPQDGSLGELHYRAKVQYYVDNSTRRLALFELIT